MYESHSIDFSSIIWVLTPVRFYPEYNNVEDCGQVEKDTKKQRQRRGHTEDHGNIHFHVFRSKLLGAVVS